jgi:ABC-2 type transport system permease protein
MDAAPINKPVKLNRLLPYWAVFQADVRQTLDSWVYRIWVLITIFAAVGFLLYRMGVYREAGIVQHASTLVSDLLRWCLLGSLTLIVVLTAGSISAERGTIADSVLSRGISRYQYFLGKWHARLVTVTGTFFLLGTIILAASMCFLHEDLSWMGSLLALLTLVAVLSAVITCGVSVSGMVSNSLASIAVVWVTLYGLGFGLSFLPAHFPSPYRALSSLPEILRGEYNIEALTRLIGWCVIASVGLAVIGMASFSRRDV